MDSRQPRVRSARECTGTTIDTSGCSNCGSSMGPAACTARASERSRERRPRSERRSARAGRELGPPRSPRNLSLPLSNMRQLTVCSSLAVSASSARREAMACSASRPPTSTSRSRVRHSSSSTSRSPTARRTCSVSARRRSSSPAVARAASLTWSPAARSISRSRLRSASPSVESDAIAGSSAFEATATRYSGEGPAETSQRSPWRSTKIVRADGSAPSSGSSAARAEPVIVR